MRLATASWQLPSQLQLVKMEFLGRLSAMRFILTLLREGSINHQWVAAILEVDSLKAPARPQMGLGAIRARARAGPFVNRQSRRPLPLQEEEEELGRMTTRMKRAWRRYLGLPTDDRANEACRGMARSRSGRTKRRSRVCVESA